MMNAVGSWAVRLTRRAMRFSLRLAHWMARSAAAFRGPRLTPSGVQCSGTLIPLRRQGNAGVLVLARPHGARFEDLALMDPAEGVLEDLLGVGLEHDPLAGPPPPGVHLRQKALGEFVAVMLGVELGPQVDVALREAQGRKIFPQVLAVGIAGDHRGHHEAGVDYLAKTELLEKIVRSGEHCRCRHLPVDELLQPRKKNPVGEREL